MRKGENVSDCLRNAVRATRCVDEQTVSDVSCVREDRFNFLSFSYLDALLCLSGRFTETLETLCLSGKIGLGLGRRVRVTVLRRFSRGGARRRVQRRFNSAHPLTKYDKFK
jgi:hypothetical protein